MARQEINIGAAPTGVGGDTPRSASIKINAMTQELFARQAQLGTAATQNVVTGSDDFTPGRVSMMGHAGWGSTPISKSPTDDANELPRVSGLFQFGNGGINLPNPFVQILQIANSGGYVWQTAKAMLDESVYMRGRRGDGAWSPWRADINSSLFAIGIGQGASTGELMGLSAAQTASPNKANTGLYSYYGHPDGVPGFGAISVLSQAWGHDPQWRAQLSMAVSGDGIHFRQFSVNPGAAAPNWRSILHNGNAISGVLNAGPSGALPINSGLIERGGALDNWYFRFAGGLQICQQRFTGYTAGVTRNVAWLAAFADTPVAVFPNIYPSIDWDMSARCYGNSGSYFFMSDRTLNNVVTVTAIGRWHA
ncbi:hypothetical protein HU733_08935 [Pseudomonas paralactis]|uniref:hypothetical protein n=1 Tax=Pseudomonas paralactis TaxID=1615673 RepID=UPI0016483B5A|nr:hypothetical protein [Pseudomonas paralactis]MBC3255615.1 hypothetical protein [Pseudomonas paralactis]